ncbi:variant erythrocyte surface antigen-1 family protein [Babesia caballi]|uniref:Variant erythrocyte surface antigen-1 family protein n=1 Tax=Babesia caballi TaxID=5871 RepID=A0AAV4LNF1_BABCB|nr:variant erythrocyte surface antigen-1 family protein [Babesia caballi]
MAAEKKLTDLPKDLKEAIDWVLRVSELAKINDLAAALEKLLKRDGSDAAVRVKGLYGEIIKKFCINFDNNDGRPSPVLKYYLKNLEKLGPVKRPDDETNDETFLKKFKDGSTGLKTSITKLPDSLKKFLGRNGSSDQGIIKQNSRYTSDYQNADWKSEKASDYAVILLAIAPMLLLGLGYLHSKCKDTANKGWKDIKIKDSQITRLGQFLVDMGFPETVLNSDKQGSHIFSQLSGFSELQSTNASFTDRPYNFFKELHKKPLNHHLLHPPTPSPHSTYLATFTLPLPPTPKHPSLPPKRP